MQKKFRQSGFTLIEILITMTIFAIISMIANATYKDYINTANNSGAVSHITTLSLLIDDYYRDTGRYPNSLNDIRNGNLLDPWGRAYSYLNLNNSQTHGGSLIVSGARKDRNLVPINSNYDLYSFGKDGKSKPPLTAKDSHDDIIYASDGAYIGIAKSF